MAEDTDRCDGVTLKCSQKASSNLIFFKRQIVAPINKYVYLYIHNTYIIYIVYLEN